QQGVLLRLVPAVDLVYKERGALVIQIAPLARFGNRLADLFDARQHGVNRDEMAFGGVGDDARQGCFAGPRRPVEDERRELVGLDGSSHRRPGTNVLLLAHKFIKRPWTHAVGQRRLLLYLSLPGLTK